MKWVFALGVVAVFSLGHAGPAAQRAAEATFDQFVSELQEGGADNFIRPNIASLLGLTPKAPSKAYIIDVLKKDGAKQTGKTCNLVLTEGEAKPLCAVFLTATRNRTKNESYYFKATPDGTLLSAFRMDFKLSKEGTPVPGSTRKTDLDVNAAKTQNAFKRELKFWLSGEYKKHLLQSK
jgi:hypothetical protein